MSYQQKENSGAIFKNDRKEKETHPDYTGIINVAGKDYQISLWIKEGKKGKFFSASIKEPYVKKQYDEPFTSAAKQSKTFTDTSDDLPF